MRKTLALGILVVTMVLYGSGSVAAQPSSNIQNDSGSTSTPVDDDDFGEGFDRTIIGFIAILFFILAGVFLVLQYSWN